MSLRALGHRAPLVWLLLPLIAGLAAARVSPHALPPLPLFAGATALLILAAHGAWRGSTRAWAAGCAGGMVLAGLGYYELRRDRLAAWEGLPTREARVVVDVQRVFASTEPDRWSALGKVVAAPHPLTDLKGQRIALALRWDGPAPRPIRGARIEVGGLLVPVPRYVAARSFEAYLADVGANFQLQRGRLVAVVNPGSTYARARERWRQRAADCLGHGLEEHPTLAAASRGMLLGERAGLSPAQEGIFLRSGTMHLFSISGLHIGVIATGVILTLRLVRVPDWPRFLLSAALLGFYVDVTGAVPSAIRAWLMVVCLHAAALGRAPGNVVSALLASALLVLLLDPLQLFGAGFQMSYGIMIALLLYGLPLAGYWTERGRLWAQVPAVSLSRWQRMSDALCQKTLQSLAIGLAASLVGLISSVAFFNVLTPASLLINLVLMPVASGAILAGFAALVTGLAGLAPLNHVFNHSAALLIHLMQQALTWVDAVPGSSAPAGFVTPWFGTLSLLTLFGCCFVGYAQAWTKGPVRYWTPPLVLLVALLAGLRWG